MPMSWHVWGRGGGQRRGIQVGLVSRRKPGDTIACFPPLHPLCVSSGELVEDRVPAGAHSPVLTDGKPCLWYSEDIEH